MESVLRTSVQDVDLKKDLNCRMILALFSRQVPLLRLMKHSSKGLSTQVVLNNECWIAGERDMIPRLGQSEQLV